MPSLPLNVIDNLVFCKKKNPWHICFLNIRVENKTNTLPKIEQTADEYRIKYTVIFRENKMVFKADIIMEITENRTTWTKYDGQRKLNCLKTETNNHEISGESDWKIE